MTRCNYLQGDLFERFRRNNLPTPSYIPCSIQFNCAQCAPTQWNSARRERWMELRLHSSAIVCMLVTTHRLVSIPRCVFFLITASESALCLSSCLWLLKKCAPPSSAWPSVAMATHGSREWWLVRRARHRLSQKKYLYALRRCLHPHRRRTSMLSVLLKWDILTACWQRQQHRNIKRPVTRALKVPVVQVHFIDYV